jgi:hypothetical protein
MSTGTKRTPAGTPDNGTPNADPHASGKRAIEDLEYAIDLLRVKLQSAPGLSQKVRLYNQIKTLQENIARLKMEG